MGSELYTSVDQLADEWEQLAGEAQVAPFLRPGWIGAWWRAFGKGKLTILAERRDGALVGVLPLVERGLGAHMPVNWHTPEFGPTAAGPEAERAVVERLFARRPAYVNARFLDAADTAFLDAARTAGYVTSSRPLLRSPYLPLDGGWESLSKPREKQAERAWRKLDELGRAEFEARDGTEDLDSLLADGFAVEGSGWKTAQGTAIISRPETRAFYTDVAHWAAGRGILRLFFLRCGGRAIAFEFGLEDGGRYYFVKGGYDPEFRKQAPGFLIMREVIRWSCERGLKSFEFLGADDPQKLEWTSLLRERVAVEAFAPTIAGRAARLAQAHGRPLAKRTVGVLKRVASRGARDGT